MGVFDLIKQFYTNLFAWINAAWQTFINFYHYFMKYPGALADLIRWVFHYAFFLFQYVYKKFLGPFIAYLRDLDLPCTNCAVYLHDSVLAIYNGGLINIPYLNITVDTWQIFSYFTNMFAVKIGIECILCAYLARFIIRRIPFIG